MTAAPKPRSAATQLVPVAAIPQVVSFARFIPIVAGRLDHARAVPMIEFAVRVP